MGDYNLELKIINGLNVLTSPELLRERSMLIAYTTRTRGVSSPPYDSLNLGLHVGDVAGDVRQNRHMVTDDLRIPMKRLTTAKQVHKDVVTVITENNAGAGAVSYETAIDDTDALITNVSDTPLMILTADCLPVALASKDQHVIGAVHAGSEGVYLEIVLRALELMKSSFKVVEEDMLAFIGPGIRACCYEVSDERADIFKAKFGKDAVTGDRHLDLPGIVRSQLLAAGVKDEDIYDTGLCTCCREDQFFSYRRDGKCGRQALIVANIGK